MARPAPLHLNSLDIAHDLHDRIGEYHRAGLLGATHFAELVRRVEELMGWLAIGHREQTVLALKGLIARVRGLSQSGILNVVQASGLISLAEMLLQIR